MRLAAQERRREGNEPQTTKVAHHATYPRHEGFEVEIQDEDAAPVGTSSERLKAVEFGVVPAVSRLQPSDVGLDGVGGAAGGVSGGQGMEVEVTGWLLTVLVIVLILLFEQMVENIGLVWSNREKDLQIIRLQERFSWVKSKREVPEFFPKRGKISRKPGAWGRSYGMAAADKFPEDEYDGYDLLLPPPPPYVSD